MAVVIRMRRSGSKKRPFYHVVAADKRAPRDGRCIEQLGVYDPREEPFKFEVKHDRIEYWKSHGATVSLTVSQLMAKRPATAEQK